MITNVFLFFRVHLNFFYYNFCNNQAHRHLKLILPTWNDLFHLLKFEEDVQFQSTHYLSLQMNISMNRFWSYWINCFHSKDFWYSLIAFLLDIGFEYDLIKTFIQMNRKILKKILNLLQNDYFYYEFTMVKLLYNYCSLIINYHLKLS